MVMGLRLRQGRGLTWSVTHPYRAPLGVGGLCVACMHVSKTAGLCGMCCLAVCCVVSVAVVCVYMVVLLLYL